MAGRDTMSQYTSLLPFDVHLGDETFGDCHCTPTRDLLSTTSASMQAPSTHTEVTTTSAQSLIAIQTLLRASLGCITFLRDLLPSDNFTDSNFTSSDVSFLFQSSDANRSIDSSKGNGTNVNGFKIMTMTLSSTHETDKFINYLEYGIFDALQKQYLRSFIFAIYLDEKDPNKQTCIYPPILDSTRLPSIVESYTFNFHYHNIPGTNAVIPLMSAGENKNHAGKDPVSIAVKNGKTLTLKDVKKSTILKTLIYSTTQMDVLPTFKLFYTDETPADYEPPHFQAGDAQNDKWYFVTHDMDEVPDNVNLSVASIAMYLPSSTENDHVTFIGTVSRPSTPPPLTPDAEKRNVVWGADAAVEGDDVDCPGDGKDSYNGDFRRNAKEGMVPIGIRNADGVIELIPQEMEPETHFEGTSQMIPTRLDEVNALGKLDNTDLEQTQSFPDFPPAVQDRNLYHNDSLPPSDLLSSSTALALENQGNMDDAEILDMETQMSIPDSVDPIQSFDADMEDQIQEDMPTPNANATIPLKTSADSAEAAVAGISPCAWGTLCASMVIEQSLQRPRFHSVKDVRIPEECTCFDCRVHADNSWELIKVDLYPKMLNLALFRRAIIKVADIHNPSVVAEFAKLVGCDNLLARQLLKLLENEGFIAENTLEIDDLDFMETRSKETNTKSKGKQTKQRNNVQKVKYSFNHACLSTSQYTDYFDLAVNNRKATDKTRPNADVLPELPSLLVMTACEES
ncbi:HORMA domain-containing protein [Mycena amicta]|nr:HORMA domain-containing protein [Mycena amicta]